MTVTTSSKTKQLNLFMVELDDAGPDNSGSVQLNLEMSESSGPRKIRCRRYDCKHLSAKYICNFRTSKHNDLNFRYEGCPFYSLKAGDDQ